MAGIVDLESKKAEVDGLLFSVDRDKRQKELLAERISLIRSMDIMLSLCRDHMRTYDHCKKKLEHVDRKLKGYRLGLTEFDL